MYKRQDLDRIVRSDSALYPPRPSLGISRELLQARCDEKGSPGHFGQHRGSFDDDASRPTQRGRGPFMAMGTWSYVIIYPGI